jgi:ABC-2 type transport system ATP-binding protein
MITLEHLTKRYGDTTAVDDLSVTVLPGRVTAFLGPNGAGKSTTMRMLLGLDHPTAGRALIDGRPYRAHRHPLRLVGAHLDGRAVHPGRSARQHLLALARANGISARRVDEVLESVGLAKVARQRAGAFSLGMGQRLGIAAALLGDPCVLVLDEPVNGLDTDGVRWMRTLLRGMADEGRTVLVSSHLLAEVHQSADHVLVIGRGRLLADCPTSELVATAVDALVLRTPDIERVDELRALLPHAAVEADASALGQLRLTGASPEQVGDAAHAVGLRVHHLAPVAATLEAAYLRLVGEDVEYAAGRRPAVTEGA